MRFRATVCTFIARMVFAGAVSAAAEDLGPTTGQQGPRIFVRGEEGTIYVLFVRGITRIDPASCSLTVLAQSPVPIDAGGDYLNGRIYFASGSRLYSYRIKK